MEYLTFALAKGRLATKTLSILETIGITCEEMKDKDSRKLIFVNEELKLKFFLAKATDVPTYVEYGAADIGVVGRDTILEEDKKIYEVLDLDIGKCRMCVAAKKGFEDNTERALKVATKFPNIARNYYAKLSREIDIIKLNGSIEIAPILNLSDVIVDIVETGTTLLENDLEPIEEIVPISARLVANKTSYKFKYDEISKLCEKLSNLENK